MLRDNLQVLYVGKVRGNVSQRPHFVYGNIVFARKTATSATQPLQLHDNHIFAEDWRVAVGSNRARRKGGLACRLAILYWLTEVFTHHYSCKKGAPTCLWKHLLLIYMPFLCSLHAVGECVDVVVSYTDDASQDDASDADEEGSLTYYSTFISTCRA